MLTRSMRTETSPVTIELLYVDGCPNHEGLLDRLHALRDELDPTPELVLRRISDDAAAQRARFLGSPTVRVDGRDIELGADERTDFGVKCRLYVGPTGLSGLPADDWLLAALDEEVVRGDRDRS